MYERALQHAAEGATDTAVAELRLLLEEPLLAPDACECNTNPFHSTEQYGSTCANIDSPSDAICACYHTGSFGVFRCVE